METRVIKRLTHVIKIINNLNLNVYLKTIELTMYSLENKYPTNLLIGEKNPMNFKCIIHFIYPLTISF